MKKNAVVILISSILMSLSFACGEKDDFIGVTEGRYLKAGNGQSLICVNADGENQAYPCVMTAADDSVSFDSVDNGDLIRITYDVIRESYPAQTKIYSIELLSRGELSDIDPELLAKLSELGWLDDESNGFSRTSSEIDTAL